MTAFLREWITSILAAAMVLGILLSLMPKGSVRQVGALAAGMVLFLVILRPVLQVIPGQLMDALEEQYVQAGAYSGSLDAANESYLESIMSQRCAEYIVSQAGGMGCQVEAMVECDWQDGYPVPCAVTIRGTVDGAVKTALESDIESQLGIMPQAITYEEAVP